MEMYKEMSRTMEMMKDFMPDLSSFVNAFSNETDPSSPQGDDSSGGGFDMMGMLMNMLTPEQKQMYEMFGGNQNAE